jgi:2-haloacid dehalogenase
MINTVIFDLGGVLIDWNPRYLYQKIFKTEEEIDYFLENICTSEWNEEQDGGRSLSDATRLLVEKHPEHKTAIEHYYNSWEEMLNGEISGTVEVLEKLKKSGKYKLYALTNWSSETFPIALKRFPFLSYFDGIVVSGKEKDRKPFPSFYQLMLDRYRIDAATAVFIDDRYSNIEGAEKVGISGIHYTDPVQLENDLKARGVTL